MDKRALIKKIVTQLGAELELLVKAARAAHAEATHESSKAENKNDTRGLEASNLAHGQSKQVAELEQSIEEFKALPARKFTADDAINLGALVELKSQTESAFYFLGPRAGGTEVVQGQREILVITPASPLGQQLVGRKQGEKVKLQLSGTKTESSIAAVH